MATTSPDNVYFLTGTQPQSLQNYSATHASSVQNALALRERYTFVWANQSERVGQAGMVESSTGYQIDTKTEYIYENSSWRLKTPFAVFTASKSIPYGVNTNVGVFSLQSGLSSSSSFISAGADGILNFVDPGIYILTWTGNFATAPNARAYIQISGMARSSVGEGEDTVSLTVVHQVTTPNSSYSFQAYHTSGSAGTNINFITQRVNIARLS